jgi:hypothetical protein
VKTVSYGHNLLGTFRQLAKIAKMLTNAQPLRPRTVCRLHGSYAETTFKEVNRGLPSRALGRLTRYLYVRISSFRFRTTHYKRTPLLE